MKKLLKIFLSFHLFALFLLGSCSESPSNKKGDSNQSNQNSTKKSISGIYSYSDSSVESVVRVSENNWKGKLLIKSGFGSSYDNSNASYSSGTVRNAILYDESGYIELGSVNGTSLSIPIGSTRVTHYK